MLSWGAILCLLPPLAFAASPKLESVTPVGAERGTEVELTLAGERLQDAKELMLFEPGAKVLALENATNRTVRARLQLARDCPLGEHHLRLRTASGLTELRTFYITSLPIVEEKEPNNDAAHAQRLSPNTVVAGVVTSEDVDCYSLEAKKGERISAEIIGIRLGRAEFDPCLTLSDVDGKVLATAEDTWVGTQDPFLSVTAPKDGRFILQVREATYGGNPNCHYLLAAGNYARPTSIYPAGGPAGESLAVACYSEATGNFTNTIKLPAENVERFPFFAESGGLAAPSPNWLRVSTFPNVLQTLPNQSREQATATEHLPPFALNGILSHPGEHDWFRFPAKKGEALSVQVFARRLRSPVDSVLEVFDAKGASLASNDDSSGADSSLKFTPSESTNYFVCIHDSLGAGGRDFVYRIEVTPVAPSLTVKIPEVARNDTQSRQFIAVPRGNRFATRVAARRSDFSGELHFQLEGLPEGVSMSADAMSPNVDEMPLVFEAAPNAPVLGKLVDLVASGTNGAARVRGSFRQDVELVSGPPNNACYYQTAVDKLCIATTKESPFKIHIVEPKVPLVQNGTMRLEVVAERAPGFDEPIEVEMVWNPPGVSSQSEATIPKGATNVFYQLNANGGAELRTWKIAVQAHATVEGGPLYVSSQLAPLEIAAPYVAGKIETLWLNPGKTGKMTVNLQQAKPFDGRATIKLCGLPERASTTEREIGKDDQEVTFDITADPKCPNGTYKNLFCSVEVKANGQMIPHNIAHGGILRVVPPKKDDKKLVTVVEGKK